MEGDLFNKQGTDHRAHILYSQHYAWELKGKLEKQSILSIEINMLMVKAIGSYRELKWKRTEKFI